MAKGKSANIEQLEADKYEYIIGARIRSMSKADKEAVLRLGLRDGQSESITLNGKRHVISMSDSRAKKDARDREKGIKRLEKRFASGKITKASVNNRGYNRFLTLEGDTTVTIDSGKIAADALLDGLKGFVTNSNISDGEVIENYRNLHFIERAFRMNTDDASAVPRGTDWYGQNHQGLQPALQTRHSHRRADCADEHPDKVTARAVVLVLPLRYVAGQREQPWKRGFLLHLHR